MRELAARTTPDYRSLLTTLAGQLEGAQEESAGHALALVTSELRQATSERKRSEERLQSLAEVSREFAASSGELGQLLELVARRLGDLLGDVCAIRTISVDGQWIEASGAVYHRDPALLAVTQQAMESRPQRVGQGTSGLVAATGQAVLVKQLVPTELAASTAPEHLHVLEQLGASSSITLPLRYRGEVVGVANLLRGRDSEPYDERDLAFAESLAEHAAVAIANARARHAEREAAQAAERAIAALRQAEARLSCLSQSGVLGIIVGTLDGRITEVNDTLLTMVGYSREEILSGAVPWPELTPPEWREVDARAIAQLRRSGIGGLREKELIRRDGTRVSVMINSAQIEGGSGESVSYVLDLTARKQAEAALAQLREQRAADERFRALLESAPDAMVVTHEDGSIALVNRQAEKLFGYTRAELIGQPIELLLPDPPGASSSARLESAPSEPIERGALELHGQRKDGQVFSVEVSASPLQTEGGSVVLRSIRDITERKKAERQRASLAAIVGASDDAIIGKTTSGEITSWNQGATRLFGYTAEEAIGKSISLIIPPGRELEEVEILRALGSGQTLRFDTRRRRKDGSEVDVSVTASPLFDRAGRVIGIAKVARDITDRRRAEAALEHARDEAQAASRELEAFSYSVAHDLRAPLRGMNGFARILLEDYADVLDAEGVDCLHEIQSNADKMAELIDALLSLSRTTRAELRPQRLDLSELTLAAAARLAAATPERVVSVQVQDKLVVYMDPVLTRVMFDNLLGNAWKFTANEASARIEIGAVQLAEGRAVFVRDNGAGFDMAHARKLFTPFQRLHTTSEFPGTGIGLATVQRIALRHGARVWAEGKVGQGATFYLGLPTTSWAAS